MLIERSTLVKVVGVEHMQEALKTLQTLQEDDDSEEELEHHRDVRINRDPKRWIADPFLVVDPFIGSKVSSCDRFWVNTF